MGSNGSGNGSAQRDEGRIIPFNERFNSFGTFMNKMKGQLMRALPKHISADRMIRIILTTVQRTPELLDCTPESMLGAVLQCAQLGLEPDGVLGQAYLIPFNNFKRNRKEVQLIVGYKGLVKLAYQSGDVGAVRARIVRERDRFEYSYGLDESLIHEPWRQPDAGEMVAVYAVAKIRQVEDPQFLVLERWEVDEIRARSKSAKEGPWVTDYAEMAKKSALRRLCKMLPASVEKDNLARAIALDERAEAEISQELDKVIDITPENVTTTNEPATAAAAGATGASAGTPPADGAAGAQPPGEQGADQQQPEAGTQPATAEKQGKLGDLTAKKRAEREGAKAGS